MTPVSLEPVPREMIGTPAGYVLVLRQEVGADHWILRVLNFATWKHLKYSYPTEAEARTAYDMWRL